MTATLTPAVDLTLIKMKWRETYVSEGLNKKLIASQPPGIYRGFTLAFDGTQGGGDRRVAILSDADTVDHVAVYQTSDGFSLTYFDDAGTTILLDLADPLLDSAECVIALLADYTVGADTTAEFHAYTVADYLALPVGTRSELVVLGTVNVPAAATNVLATAINFNRRTLAWEGVSRGAVPWMSLLRNPSFEWGTGTAAALGGGTNGESRFTHAFWDIPHTAGEAVLSQDIANPHDGGMALNIAYPATTASSLDIQQHLNMPVVPGQLIQANIWVDVLKPTTAGLIEMFWEFRNVTTGAVDSTLTEAIDTSLVTGGYAITERTVVVPATPDLVLSRAGVRLVGANVGSTGDAFRIDDFQMWLEAVSVRTLGQDKTQRMAEVSAYPLVFDDPADPDDDGAPLLRYDSANTRLLGSRRDRLDEEGIGGDPALSPVFEWLGQISAGQGLTDTVGDKLEVAQFLAHHLSSTGATAAARTLVFGSESEVAARPTTRLYIADDGQFELTWNAWWDHSTTTWFEDSTLFAATMLKADVNGDFLFAHKPDSETTGVGWADTFGASTGWHRQHLFTDGANDTISTDSVIVGLGAAHLASDVLANNARVSAAAGTIAGIEYTLMWESVPAGEKGYRKYVSPTGVMLETVNAVYDNTTNLWAKDVNGVTAIRMTLSSVASAGFLIDIQQAGVDSWADGAWTTNVISADETAFDALVAANGNLTATTMIGQINQLLSGVHGPKTLHLTAAAGEIGFEGAVSYFETYAGGGNNWASKTSGGTKYVVFPLPLIGGDRITAANVWGTSGDAGGEELQAKIETATTHTGSVQVSTTKTSGLASGLDDVGWTTADTDLTPNGYTVAAGFGVYIHVRLPQTSGAGEVSIFSVDVTYDHP